MKTRIYMKQHITQHHIFLSGIEVEYSLTRKNIKNINLRIKADGLVSVSAPYSIRVTEIEDFMRSKSSSIIENILKFKQLQKELPSKIEYVDGDSFYLLGKSMTLKVIHDSQDDIWIDGDYLYLKMKDVTNLKRKVMLVQRFLDQRRIQIAEEITDEIYPLFAEYNLVYPILKIRSMKSRWGSCMPSKNQITFSKMLFATPMTCVEYVVLHELAHLIHPNHSKEFYNLVAKLMPDWKARKQLLESFARTHLL